MKTVTTKIESAIESVINGFSSTYITYSDENDITWTIRVSNHMANPSRVTDNFISLVVDAPKNLNSEDNWSINEKSFREIDNQFYLNDEGGFLENFSSVEAMLDYVIN